MTMRLATIYNENYRIEITNLEMAGAATQIYGRKRHRLTAAWDHDDHTQRYHTLTFPSEARPPSGPYFFIPHALYGTIIRSLRVKVPALAHWTGFVDPTRILSIA